MIACFIDDLVLGSRIRSTAESLGIAVGFCRNESGFADLAASPESEPVSAVLVDLESTPGASGLIAAMRKRRAAEGRSRWRIIAFGPHVRRDLREAAQNSGADEVITRKEMFSDLRLFLQRIADAEAS